jgi:hypothetical protein
MSFFDSKQEVLNIELTQYGKYLLSKGKFSPSYYAFFDDDVVYDSLYMNVTESQNYSQDRILNETPISKPTYNFSSVEQDVNEQQKLIITENLEGLKKLEDGIKSLSNTSQASVLPLGTSAFNSEYYPAWSIKVVSGSIERTEEYLDNSLVADLKGVLMPYLRVPQISCATSSYGINAVTSLINNKDDVLVEIFIDEDNSIFLTGDKKNLTNIFDILEENVEDKKENFDIEVFIEEERTKADGTSEKYLNKLYFFKKPTNIKNNILLDEYIYKEAENAVPDETNVEYYFDLLIDNEIDLPPEAKLGIGADIYSSTITEADKPFGEDC